MFVLVKNGLNDQLKDKIISIKATWQNVVNIILTKIKLIKLYISL